MFRKLIASVAVVGTLALAGCDIEAVAKDLQQQIIDEAFKNVVENAKNNGGDAVMLHAGTAATLVITNNASPLFGASVSVPADALPADVKNAALAIQTPPAGTSGLDFDLDHIKNAGPVALLAIVQIPEGTEVKLVKAITVTLPYAKDVSFPAEKLQLSNFPKRDATEPVVVAGSKSDTAKKSVTGALIDPNILRAVWPVDYAAGDVVAANSFIYKVTGSDTTTVLCVGRVDEVATKVINKNRVDNNPNADVYSLSLAGIGSGLNFVSTEADAIVLPPVSPNTKIVNADLATLTVTCKGVTYTASAATKSSLTFANFVQVGTGNPHVGSVDVTSDLDFTTLAGEKVIAALRATVTDFSWAE